MSSAQRCSSLRKRPCLGTLRHKIVCGDEEMPDRCLWRGTLAHVKHGYLQGGLSMTLVAQGGMWKQRLCGLGRISEGMITVLCGRRCRTKSNWSAFVSTERMCIQTSRCVCAHKRLKTFEVRSAEQTLTCMYCQVNQNVNCKKGLQQESILMEYLVILRQVCRLNLTNTGAITCMRQAA